MTNQVTLRHGIEPLAAIKRSPTPFFMLHGGAGPQDPKGEKAKEAHLVLNQLCKKVTSNFPQGKDTKNTEQIYPAWFVNAMGTALSETSLAARLGLYAASLLEEHPLFNAGFGAALQEDGTARVSASFMESGKETFSAIANAEGVINPSLLAAFLQNKRFRVLDGNGSKLLCRELGIPNANLITEQRFERWVELKKAFLFEKKTSPNGTGTIGCVSVDADLNLAATTSTGGVGNETVGRMGDTPTIAGNYCTKKLAISCTGYGEQIINHAFAARVATRTEDGLSLEESMKKTLAECSAKNYGLAAIAMCIQGEKLHWCAGTTEGFFIWAYRSESQIQTFWNE